MKFREAQAIYLQIADYVCEQILLGRWQAGGRLPSVRELGADLEVNPNTAMRSYDWLQNSEIIFNRRGVGYFVAEDAQTKILDYRRKQFLETDVPLIYKNMQVLGMTVNELEVAFKNLSK